MNQMSKLDAFIQQAVTAMPISGTSLIASLYGDALLQRGWEVWLGSVAALLEGLGFGERFVRTALFRLNKEEWLDVVRIGRRSFYRLSDKALIRHRYLHQPLRVDGDAQGHGTDGIRVGMDDAVGHCLGHRRLDVGQLRHGIVFVISFFVFFLRKNSFAVSLNLEIV